MKTLSLSPLLLLLALSAPAWPGDAPPGPPPAPPATVPDDQPPAPGARLVLEFRGARLGEVLDYLSKEAGFVIVNPIELAAPLTLVAKRPLTPSEAVDALNGVLVDQGYAAIVRGRTLRVVPLPQARQQNLPVVVGADPARMPEGDAMVTQVIPVQFATAKDLVDNLTPLLNTTYAVLAANESANILILTDTQSNVRRIASIVHAIDSSLAGEQQIKVFHLVHADADKVAQVISTLYGRQAAGGRNQQNNQRGGFGFGFPGGGFGGFGGNGGGNGNGGGRGGGNQAGGGAGSADASRAGEVVAASDNGTNSVVVRASPGSLALLSEVIEQLDVDTTGKDGVLLYRVRNGKATDLAKSLNDLFQGTQSTSISSNAQRQTGAVNRTTTPAAGGQARAVATGGGAAGGGALSGSDSSLDLSGQVRVVADETSNSVLVLTQERNFDRLRKILTDMDTAMRQVLVRVLVAEVTLEKGLDVGVQLEGINPSTATTETRTFSNFNLFDSTLGLNGYLLDSSRFRAAIRALASNTRFDVLSRPYILTTDNRLATVNVSQEVPVINGSRTDQNNNVTNTFDRRDVGIILNVTPQINSDGRVLLDVSQELSALADKGITVAPGVDSPIINKRTMTTRVAVDNGQTVVVGGLVHDSLTENVQKIPLLGDIPLLGMLFRRTTSTKTKTELLVFLTPQVIHDSDDLTGVGHQLRNEMQQMDAAVEPGTLQRHLDQLQGLKVGQPLPPAPQLQQPQQPAGAGQ